MAEDPASAELADVRAEVTDDVFRVSVRGAQESEDRHPFATLPEPIALADTVTEHDTDPGPDPYGGRDTETDFLLRHAGP